MQIIKTLLASLLFICAMTHAAQPLPIDQAFQFSASTKDYQTIVLHWKIAPTYYLYRNKFKVTAIKPKLTLPPPILPFNFKTKNIPSVGKLNVYSGNLFVTQPVLSTKQTLITLHVYYQGCSSGGFCYPPITKAVTVNMQGNYGDTITGVSVDTSTQPSDTNPPVIANKNTPQQQAQSLLTGRPWWQMILGFIAFGILISFTPCVLPMVPILSGIIIGQGKISHARSFLLSLAYVLGMAITYAIAGIIFGYIGGSLQAAFQKPWLITLFALIFVVMALSLFDLFDIQLPTALQNKLAKAGEHQNHHKLIGVLMMGVFSTLVLSPCVTAPLVAVLAYISQSGHASIGGIALFSMGLGMGLPLLLIGAFGPKLLPHTGHWMVAIKHLLGVMLLGIAVWMLARILPANVMMLLWSAFVIGCGIGLGALTTSQGHWQHTKKAVGMILFIYGIVISIGAWLGNTNPLQPLYQQSATSAANRHFIKVKSIDDVYAQLNRKKNQGRPVLLDFYAKWCVACHEMESRTFNQPHVIEALKDTVLLRADITKNDMTDKLLMQHFHVVAPPTIIFYNAKHQQAKQAIVGFVDADTLLKRLSDKH